MALPDLKKKKWGGNVKQNLPPSQRDGPGRIAQQTVNTSSFINYSQEANEKDNMEDIRLTDMFITT